MRLNLIRIVALPNLQFLTFILIPALPSHRTMSPGQRKKVLPARSLRHSRKWYTTPPPSTGQATDTAVGVNEIGRLTTSFATNDATPSPPKVATRMWYPCPAHLLSGGRAARAGLRRGGTERAAEKS